MRGEHEFSKNTDLGQKFSRKISRMQVRVNSITMYMHMQRNGHDSAADEKNPGAKTSSSPNP